AVPSHISSQNGNELSFYTLIGQDILRSSLGTILSYIRLRTLSGRPWDCSCSTKPGAGLVWCRAHQRRLVCFSDAEMSFSPHALPVGRAHDGVVEYFSSTNVGDPDRNVVEHVPTLRDEARDPAGVLCAHRQ